MTVVTRKKFTLMPAIALAALSLMVALPTLSSMHLYAASAQRYATVTVHPGDTLWSIASAHTNDAEACKKRSIASPKPTICAFQKSPRVKSSASLNNSRFTSEQKERITALFFIFACPSVILSLSKDSCLKSPPAHPTLQTLRSLRTPATAQRHLRIDRRSATRVRRSS